MDIAKPATIWSLGKVAVSAGYLAAFALLRGRYPFLIGGFIFLPACVMAVLRHTHAMIAARPYLRVEDDGIHLRIWDARFLVPMALVSEAVLPWETLEACNIRTFTVNGIASSALELKGGGTYVSIEPYVFSESAHTLQDRIVAADVKRRAERRVISEKAAAEARDGRSRW